jgi:hypothetical protein
MLMHFISFHTVARVDLILADITSSDYTWLVSAGLKARPAVETPLAK